MLGLYTVPNALRAAGVKVECKTDHYEQDADDAKWVPEVGAKGWIILSADKGLKHNLIEIVALLKSNTHSFLLTSADFSGAEMANAFVKALPDMKGIVSTIPSPAVCSVWKDGTVKVVYTHDDLIRRTIDVAERESVRAKQLTMRDKG